MASGRCPGRTTPRLAIAAWRRSRPATRRVFGRSGVSPPGPSAARSEEHTSELQSLTNLVCSLLLEKKKHRQPDMQKAHDGNPRNAAATTRNTLPLTRRMPPGASAEEKAGAWPPLTQHAVRA